MRVAIFQILLMTSILFGCASGERTPFMVVGEHNLNNGKGIDLGLGAKFGTAKFKKTPGFDLNYEHYSVSGARYIVGGGFNINRFALGVAWSESWSYYQKTREQDGKYLEGFWSRKKQGSIWSRYFHKIAADWSSQSFGIGYSFYNRLKFNNLPSGKDLVFSSNKLFFNYTLNMRRLGLNVGFDLGGLKDGAPAGVGYNIGVSFAFTRNFNLGLSLYRVDYEEKLVFEEVIAHVNYCVSLF